ncbi:MDR family MFS transporter [Nocardioides daejeonensis]|uniref:MDR family MFS transporter n=1 Tax=Nocardioides daejeonensis TaxID=1046556 RepID=UPI000D741AFF|nr:MDR family MFS transporter [Nocardioides daejeonensis]
MTQTSSSTEPNALSHREILEVLAGLLAMLFVAMLSSTIVSTALPTIIADLDGSQTQYTWVVTATLLAMTVSSPIWSKLADLFDKKLLVQLSGLIFLLGSLAAGLVHSVPQLLAARALQGLGVGGLMALSQAILGTIIPPRQRGRYSGYMAGVMAVATVSGPLLGGVLVDLAGWRWCFFAAVPISIAGLAVLQKFLHLETVRRRVQIDWWGAVFISVAASLPLVWVSFAGQNYDWLSTETALFLGGSLVALVAAVLVERKHPEPLVPPRILLETTTMLAIVASIAVGIAQFGSSVFLSQFFQTAQAYSPTEAGLLMLPLIFGSLVGATASGQIITRTGHWKPVMLVGTVALFAGLVLMGPTTHTTPMWHLSLFMVLMGLGQGALMQNLVLVVQNTVDVTDIGAASGVVSFFRSLGGTIGIAALGAVLTNRVADTSSASIKELVVSGRLSPEEAAKVAQGGGLDLEHMPALAAEAIRHAYGDDIGVIFVIAAVFSVVTFLAIWRMPRTELRTTVAKVDQAEAPQDA